ncbi:transcriptional regulator [Ktedonobacter sp. SOSP1-52]|uniref:ArsR/SmtB family transcription factor n=1 Tax=Ktedonobacter sp. SOSP1-52 TaxID=2778366 RepID=UPI001915143E|nr:helix-turn-helix transcriptional regulator [Ktedonobacter sp. SOSP1-52]GHO64576.1 transcriptional regulator [Ktedonobacter sp. SOSP1-52]
MYHRNMDTQPDIASIAFLIGEPTRATILTALLGGVSLPASELGSRCQLTQQTVSAHLAKLVAGGLLVVEPRGRHRYYRLASAEVGQALEAFQVIAPRPPVRSLRQSEEARALCLARTCYDHLAGTLGVRITHAMLQHGYLREADNNYVLTTEGEQWFTHLGIDLPATRQKRRAFAVPCLDWSERRHHLAGALGASLASHLLKQGWILRVPRSRAIRLSEAGQRGLSQELDLQF